MRFVLLGDATFFCLFQKPDTPFYVSVDLEVYFFYRATGFPGVAEEVGVVYMGIPGDCSWPL